MAATSVCKTQPEEGTTVAGGIAGKGNWWKNTQISRQVRDDVRSSNLPTPRPSLEVQVQKTEGSGRPG